MRRFLPLIVSLTVAVAALAQPAFGCVSATAAVGGVAHTCCAGEPEITTSPTPVCCVVSQPVRDQALTESLYLNTHQSSVATTQLVIRFPIPEGERMRPAGLPSASVAAPVALYLQQRALLI